ncbi:hypothetical protein CASFOL_026960 [Castilleja foliolosa]|uniref:Uncharacterized protein n=1 Tax=Castilleja foliolosa TaxID=1961234 RepID=A0ABD3CIJ5_9LAMI
MVASEDHPILLPEEVLNLPQLGHLLEDFVFIYEPRPFSKG